MRQSEGAVRIDSAVGQGTSVEVMLPRFLGQVDHEPGKGFVVVRGKEGELDVSMIAYVRYLNQLPLNYTDSFGRTFSIDLRQDLLFNKVNLSFKGWLFDPRFEYRVWVWTCIAPRATGRGVGVLG